MPEKASQQEPIHKWPKNTNNAKKKTHENMKKMKHVQKSDFLRNKCQKDGFNWFPSRPRPIPEQKWLFEKSCGLPASSCSNQADCLCVLECSFCTLLPQLCWGQHAKQTSGVNLKFEIWHMQALKLDNWPPISNKNIALNRNLSPHGIWPTDTNCNNKFNDRRPTRRQWCENHTGMTPCKVILFPQQLRSREA